MKIKHLFPALILLLLAVSDTSAQIAARMQGRVLDASGSVVGKAHIALTETATGTHRETTTSSSGDYSFGELAPGRYSIDVTAVGFQHLSRTGLTALVGDTIQVDLTLTAGGEQTTVTVNADAPLLQASVSDIETHLPGLTVVAIPLNSRNFINLTALAPGVSLPPGTLLPRINGGRPRTNEYLYDGISALQPEPGQVAFFPIVDDIREFTVEANNVPAEFGRFNGGVVNVSTRGGSNQFHGSLYDFFRNEALNSRNYFATTGRKPEYRKNLYGATLGGPVRHNSLFFFGDYQGIKTLIGKPITSTIPTLAERQGIFTGVAKIYNPLQTTVVGGRYIRPEFANDIITAPLDPVAKALLARFPTPTTTGAANNYTRTANDADHQNQFDVRVDGARGTHDHAFARYTYFSDVEQPITALPDGSGPTAGAVLGTGNVAGLSHVLGQQAVFGETHTFTDHLLNDLHLGYTRRSNNIAGPTLSSTASAALGIPGIPTNAAFNDALPLFTFTGFQQLGPAASTFSQYQTGVWQLEDAVVVNRGRHAIKAGLDFRWYQLNAVSPPNPTGSFAFTTTGTNTQTTTATTTTGGNAIASFLLGQVDTFSIDLQSSTIRPRDAIQEYFIQDDWRASDRLTLNIGARWTLHHPSTEKTNQGAIFNLTTQQLDYVGQNGNPRSARELHYDNLAPRIGLNFMLTPKTVLRSGYGIVFIDQSGITTPFTVPQFPFIQNVQQKTQDSINAAFALSSGPTVAPIPLTQAAGLGQSVYTVNRTAGSGYSQQWNVAVQREITHNLSVDIAYVGTHIVHVGIPDSNLNQLTAAQLATGLTNPTSLTGAVTNPYYGQIPSSSSIGGKTVAAAQLLKPYPRFQNVATYRNNSGQTNFNALEAKVEQRLAYGLTFLFAYTHSKLIDDASSVFSSTVLSSPNSSSLIAADTFRPYLERDSSNGDMPNVTSLSTTYELPAGKGHRFASSGVLRPVLGGWAVNAIMSLQSGMPVTVTQATNNNAFAGFALQRPNLIAQPALPSNQRSTAKWFNTASFATAPQFTLGNASRNPVRGPAYRDLDMALVKHTKIDEKTDVEFRGEIFNLANTPAFAQPNGSFGAAAFGSITATSAEQRVVQFALKLSR
ncbi:Carboxypeptidase regulatory-like domain-containing protein [Granulicella pectinivorans]|uniref:Carboxypeptidase regulatory-like domain-containing protein n=1 Tax=Granulicella pectinivorans TaxID=474950 RepID=A0A1I6M8A9_9BACT|nr:carboxypeptidase-like regulatory domain-containing protein [Granulicella pectinivorans]SFS11955.1 Carboxypeptidase regulatory-like domain-containing protein [Granulicella pectinivorans]